jgi:hypothetical protein
MKQYLMVLALLLCTAACGAPFATGDAADVHADSGGDVLVVVDAGHDVDAADALPSVDAGHDAEPETSLVEASSGDSSDGAVDGAFVCTSYPPTYYTFNVCATVASTPQSGFALSTTYAMVLAGGNECVAAMTPTACTCGDTYDCGCMMPALLAEQAAQTDSNILCAGTLSNCNVDALGVIHVTCS